jgi:hypothetical protein
MTKERFDTLVNAGVRYADGELLDYEDFKDLDEEYFNEILKNAKENAPSTESESEDEKHN